MGRVGVPTTIAGSEGFYGRVGGGGSQALPDLAAPELQDRVGSGPSADHFREGLSTFISVHAMIVAPWEKAIGLLSPVA